MDVVFKDKWDKTTLYVRGDNVTHKDTLYTALEDTWGNTPPHSSWAEQGTYKYTIDPEEDNPDFTGKKEFTILAGDEPEDIHPDFSSKPKELNILPDEPEEIVKLDKPTILIANKSVKGERGDKGDLGLSGKDGTQGPKGAKGEKGDLGPEGKPGKAGRDGRDGKDGVSPSIEQITQIASTGIGSMNRFRIRNASATGVSIIANNPHTGKPADKPRAVDVRTFIAGSGIIFTTTASTITVASTSSGGVNSINSLTGAITLTAGSNITFTTVGNDITIAASGGGAVSSVFGRTGAVVAQASDYSAYYGQLTATNTWSADNIFNGSVGIATSAIPPDSIFSIGDINADTFLMNLDSTSLTFTMGDLSGVNYGQVLTVNGGDGSLDYSVAGTSFFNVDQNGSVTMPGNATIGSITALVSPIWKPSSDGTAALTIQDAAANYVMMGFDTTNGRIIVGAAIAPPIGAFDILGKSSILTTGSSSFLNVFPFINQSGSAGYRAFWISVKQNALGSGPNLIMDVGINTAAHGAGTHSSMLSLSNTGLLTASGSLSLPTVGTGIILKSGSNARIGTGTLSGGTVTIANTSVTANTKIWLQDSSGSITNIGSLTYSISAGTSFTVTSSNVLDASSFVWLLIESQ